VKLKTSQVNVMTSSIQIRINKPKRSMITTTTYVFKNPDVYRFKIMSCAFNQECYQLLEIVYNNLQISFLDNFNLNIR